MAKSTKWYQTNEAGRVAELYEPGWYKRVKQGYTEIREKNKQFVFPLNLLPEWALRGFELPANAVAIRTIKGTYGKTAFDSEINPNGTNQYTRRTH